MRYLHPQDHHLAIIRKVDKKNDNKLHFDNIKFPVKIRDIIKFEKRIVSALVFLVMKTKKNIQFIRQKTFKSMLIYYWYKKKDFNTFIYDHALHRGRKPFCHCLQAFRRKNIKSIKKI